jgi:hypothetical protein
LYRCWEDGTQLFRPESLEESKLVYDKIIKDGTVDEIHIGIHKQLPNEQFITIEGLLYVYTVNSEFGTIVGFPASKLIDLW